MCTVHDSGSLSCTRVSLFSLSLSLHNGPQFARPVMAGIYDKAGVRERRGWGPLRMLSRLLCRVPSVGWCIDQSSIQVAVRVRTLCFVPFCFGPILQGSVATPRIDFTYLNWPRRLNLPPCGCQSICSSTSSRASKALLRTASWVDFLPHNSMRGNAGCTGSGNPRRVPLLFFLSFPFLPLIFCSTPTLPSPCDGVWGLRRG